MNNLKVAIVYDWFDKWGGIERTLLILSELFKNSVFFTSYFDSAAASWARDLKVKTTFIQNLPNLIKKNRIASLPLYPFAFESFDFSSFDLVVSVSSSFAKSIITKPETLHICYLLTPTRFLWLYPEYYFKSSLIKSLTSPYFNLVRKWDQIVSKRPDFILSISKTVQNRVKNHYGLSSEVLYPPFDINYWLGIKNKIKKTQSSHSKYYLIISRLEPYKRIDIAVEAFNILPEKNLIIVGKGSEFFKLRKLAKKNIVFLSDLSDQQLATLYSNAHAFLMPQEEDFGLTALEAELFGCPTIAYMRGGATETISEGRSGFFFEKQNTESLINAIKTYDKISKELKTKTKTLGLKNVSRFDKKIFANQFKTFIESKLEN